MRHALFKALGLFFLVQAVLTTTPKEIQLDTLRIEGVIYEPQVLFILEQPSVELITIQVDKKHDFLEEIDTPLVEELY